MVGGWGICDFFFGLSGVARAENMGGTGGIFERKLLSLKDLGSLDVGIGLGRQGEHWWIWGVLACETC